MLRKAKLRIRNAKFRDPPPRLHPDANIPDTIPTIIRLRVIGQCSVLNGPSRIDAKIVPRPFVMRSVNPYHHEI